MFRRKVRPLSEVLGKVLRDGGLEQYTQEKSIRNQTLFVKISNPALRQDLFMMRTQLVKRLNEHVGSFVISEIRIY